MKLSARNQLKGIVTNIEFWEVTVEVAPNVELTSILTK